MDKMVMRSFRASDDLWSRAAVRAETEGLKVSEVLRTALEQYASEEADAEDSETEASGDRSEVAAIVGHGRLSTSEDPETQAAVNRVAELLREGAVGVSIAPDMNPDDMPAREVLDELFDAEKFDEIDALLGEVRMRPRHVAVVDTPAFSNAKLAITEGREVSGPVTFEGPWTGDMRQFPVGTMVWDDELLPIPIIWDREDGDHSGTTVGVIDRLERVDGQTSALRPKPVDAEQVEAITAAGGMKSGMPSRLFAKFNATGQQPIRVDAPDKNGLRRVWGHAAPNGTCFRTGGSGACFQYPGDVDKEHRGFHTGALVTLDDGSSVRVGALTSGGMHVDGNLARQGVGHREAARHREDSSKVLAMVRAWEDRHGLAISGVLAADVTEKQLMQALACAPSVELWPSGRGRTLVGIHLVPTPAWPVAASAGDVIEMSSPAAIEVDGLCADCEDDTTAETEALTVTGSLDLPVADRNTEWDGQAAKDRVFDLCTDGDTVDVGCVSRAFLWRDADADGTTQAAYSLGFADVVNGELQIVPQGVAATAGGRGVDATDIPDEDKAEVRTRICSLYEVVREQIEDWPECPFERDDEDSDDTQSAAADVLSEQLVTTLGRMEKALALLVADKLASSVPTPKGD